MASAVDEKVECIASAAGQRQHGVLASDAQHLQPYSHMQSDSKKMPDFFVHEDKCTKSLMGA